MPYRPVHPAFLVMLGPAALFLMVSLCPSPALLELHAWTGVGQLALQLAQVHVFPPAWRGTYVAHGLSVDLVGASREMVLKAMVAPRVSRKQQSQGKQQNMNSWDCP